MTGITPKMTNAGASVLNMALANAELDTASVVADIYMAMLDASTCEVQASDTNYQYGCNPVRDDPSEAGVSREGFEFEQKWRSFHFYSVPGDVPLLTILPNGDVVAPSLEAASEAGRVFVASIRREIGLMHSTPESEPPPHA